MTVAPLNPPERLLCGPGPANISPAVQDAMQRPLLGHMDPDLADMMRPQEVADAVVHAVTRPRTHRVLEATILPMSDDSMN